MRNCKIIATLTYGKKISGGIFLLVIITLLLCLMMIPLIIIAAVLSTEYAVLMTLSLSLIGIPACLYIVFIRMRECKDIKQWKKDAILLSARAIEIDRIKNSWNHIVKVKISIKFNYKGKIIIQKSGDKNKRKGNLLNIHPGYDSVYRKYIGHSINILYSPKYDQVLFFKD